VREGFLEGHRHELFDALGILRYVFCHKIVISEFQLSFQFGQRTHHLVNLISFETFICVTILQCLNSVASLFLYDLSCCVLDMFHNCLLFRFYNGTEYLLQRIQFRLYRGLKRFQLLDLVQGQLGGVVL
jgi:hypothetical protein